MKLLETDNEENAVICLRIIFDLHKNFRPTLEREVQPFLDFVQRIYQGRPSVSSRPSRTAKRSWRGDRRSRRRGCEKRAHLLYLFRYLHTLTHASQQTHASLQKNAHHDAHTHTRGSWWAVRASDNRAGTAEALPAPHPGRIEAS